MFLPGESELLDAYTRTVAEQDHGIGHCVRVGCYLGVIARRIEGISQQVLRRAEMFARIHDLGMVGLVPCLINKFGPLSDEERAVIALHCERGCEMLGPIASDIGQMVRHHHENWNGSGYPDQLVGERIPLLARILRVADAFDAMTSWRPYRGVPFSIDEAVRELEDGAGTEFDPRVVEAFLAELDTIRAVVARIDGNTPLHHGRRLAIDFRVISGGVAVPDDTTVENPGVVEMLRELVCYFRSDVFIWPNSAREFVDHSQDQWLRRNYVFERAHIVYGPGPMDNYMLDFASACYEMGITHFIGYDLATLNQLVGKVLHLYLLGQNQSAIPDGVPVICAPSTQELIELIIQPWPLEIALNEPWLDPADKERIKLEMANRDLVAARVRKQLTDEDIADFVGNPLTQI